MRDGTAGVEVLRSRDEQGVALTEEEFALLDRAGRLQMPQSYIEALEMRNRVRLRLEIDHVEVFPDQKPVAARTDVITEGDND
jgi:hypothetical protein